METKDDPPFLNYGVAQKIAGRWGTPAYVYDLAELKARARHVLAFPHAFGLTARYAMKAAPNAALVKILTDLGLHIDASSGYEVRRAMAAGVPGPSISLSAQELPEDLDELLEAGIRFNACSLRQLEAYGRLRPGSGVGVRFNPGAGSGGNNRTNVGGPASSFGIWHEWVPQVKEVLQRHDLTAVRIHTHIGSGGDPAVWLKVAEMNFDLVRRFPGVRTLNLGGGFKVGRMPDEPSADLRAVGAPVKEKFVEFARETGREIELEIEPGTYLVARAGALLTTVRDIVSTGAAGYEFLKVDSGMTELLRPSLYGAQHPIHLLQQKTALTEASYIVVGHCCESGDILTPAPGDPELLAARTLPEAAVGDFCVVGGAGAYASAMTAKNYNSFPEAAEVLLEENGAAHLIRRRQPPEKIWEQELPAGAAMLAGEAEPKAESKTS